VIGDDARREIGDGDEGCGVLGDAPHCGETGGNMRALGTRLVKGERGPWLWSHVEAQVSYRIAEPDVRRVEEQRRLR
jgi:hypothetical protein